jgi:hypothetical protein
MTEADYPYHAGNGHVGKCKYNAADSYGNVKSWYQFKKDEAQIAAGCAA